MAAFGDGHEHPTETTGECVVCLRAELQQAQALNKGECYHYTGKWGERCPNPAVVDFGGDCFCAEHMIVKVRQAQEERDAAIERAEAAEALAEVRLSRGRLLWDALRQVSVLEVRV